MNLTVNSMVLNKALKQVQPAVSLNKILPILEYIHLKCSEGVCELMATNTNLTIIATFDCDHSEPFEALLPFDKVYSISALSNAPMNIKINKNIVIECDNEVYEIGKSEATVNYPKQQAFEPTFSADLDKDFIQRIQLSKNCISKNINMPQYMDVFIEVKEKKITATSTDLMQMFRCSQETDSEGVFKGLVDINFVKAANGLTSAKLSGDSKFIKIESPNLVITNRLSEQAYPDCDRLFFDVEPNCEISKSDIDAAMQKMMVFNDPFHFCTISFAKGNMKVQYEENAMEHRFKSDIKATHTVDFKELYFNGNTLKNILSLVPENEELKLTFQNERDNVHIHTGSNDLKLLIRPILLTKKN